MYQFFVENSQVNDGQIRITGGDQNHIQNVLRMKAGEKIRVSDQDGTSYFCHVELFSEDGVLAIVDSVDETGTELLNRITLYQGLPKGDKMEWIIQKAVELGVSEIVPVAMKNCVVKLDEKKAQSKVKRWQAIAESAAKQSKRTMIPQIRMPISWTSTLEELGQKDVALIPYENERGMAATREILRSIRPEQTIGIAIGPEGGFADSEISGVSEEMHRISLGRRILRTETAGLATLSMLVYELDL